jgi:hypothetical protein
MNEQQRAYYTYYPPHEHDSPLDASFGIIWLACVIAIYLATTSYLPWLSPGFTAAVVSVAAVVLIPILRLFARIAIPLFFLGLTVSFAFDWLKG